MLKVYVGEKEDALTKPDEFFKRGFNMKYLLEDFSKKVVRVIDKSDVLGEYAIKSDVLGAISPTMLSTGCKQTLISMYYPEKVILTSMFGGNCMPFICESAMDHDVTLSMNYLYNPYLDGGYVGDILILNNNKIVNCSRDFLDEYVDLMEV